ncbi:MAG: hypothetical protein JO121_24125 [Deltaproteobacteria bacterium]|nr:hypothetical protein [Deltaproteobacteria bacterium]
MYYRRPRHSRHLADIVAVWLVAVLCASRVLASPREWQPLILKGSQLPVLSGIDIGHLEVLAIHGGRAEPIPFQVDEVSHDGSYALPEGPAGMPGNPRPTLAPDDEIALIVSDLGEKGTATAQLPSQALEIEVADPLGGPLRYAYVGVAGAPRLSDRRYVAYDPRTDTVETDHYRVGLTNGLPTEFVTQNGVGEHRPNLIDRMKVRLTTLVIGLIHFSFTEDDIHSQLLAWKVGPIRMVRRLSHSVNLLLGLRSPVFERNDFFYRDHLENPFKMHFSWAPRIFFRDIRVRIDLDFNDLSGYELLWSQMSMPPLKIGNQEMEQRLAAMGSVPISWIAIRGAGRTTVQTLAPTPDLPLLNRQLYFNDAPNRPDPPEHIRGEHPGIGYVITGWEKLEGGVHTFVSLLITTRADYSPGVLMEELLSPPVVTVRARAETR